MATSNKLFNYISNKTKNVINRSFNLFLKITEEKTAEILNKPALKSRSNKFIKETTKTVSQNVRSFIAKSKTNVKKSITGAPKKSNTIIKQKRTIITNKTAEPKKTEKKTGEPKKIEKKIEEPKKTEKKTVEPKKLEEKKTAEPKKTNDYDKYFKFTDDREVVFIDDDGSEFDLSEKKTAEPKKTFDIKDDEIISLTPEVIALQKGMTDEDVKKVRIFLNNLLQIIINILKNYLMRKL